MRIRPFHIDDGIPSLPDSLLFRLFDRLTEHRRPLAEEFHGHEDFAEHMKRFSIVVLGDEEGFVYFTAKNPSSFELHFQFFCHGNRAKELGSLVVARLFEVIDSLQTLYGFVPRSNEAACRFCEAIGCTLAGVVPGQAWLAGASEDANLYYARRPYERRRFE